MNTVRLTATDLKKNTAEVLNSVIYGETVALIERYGEPVAKIIPFYKSPANLSSRVAKFYGAILDFPDVTKARKFRKRTVSL